MWKDSVEMVGVEITLNKFLRTNDECRKNASLKAKLGH
jgi:hypothetical protein